MINGSPIAGPDGTEGAADGVVAAVRSLDDVEVEDTGTEGAPRILRDCFYDPESLSSSPENADSDIERF